MKSPEKEPHIPENSKGRKTDTRSDITLPDSQSAKDCFQEAKKILLNVQAWHTIAGPGSAVFTLTDAAGREVQRELQPGDHFKINIPGPGSGSGEGDDWVKVETVDYQHLPEEDSEFLLLKVRPAANPRNEKKDTAHFFTGEANSYFLIKREGHSVSAEVHGRNELPNAEANSLGDKIRNTFVALGAFLGFSDAQWKSLTDGIINNSCTKEKQ